MIDLAALKRSAERTDDPNCVVSRRWLGQVLVELEQARETLIAVRAPVELDVAPPAHRG